MALLRYSAITSTDGYVADADGRFDWSAPDRQVHAAVNEMVRPAGTHLYGRRMYDVLRVWEDLDVDGQAEEVRDFARIWQGAQKVVYSRTLRQVGTARTRIEPEFDVEAVRAMKADQTRDITIGGPELAALAIRAGLVDRLDLFVSPVVVGGGRPALPAGVRLGLELLTCKRFAGGVVHLGYRTRS